MIFTETRLKGSYIIEPEKVEDDRGFFARIWDKEEFIKYSLKSNLVQCSISFNKKKGIIRGMHYQIKPYEEAKIVRCTRGKIFDVIIDLRPNSPTFKAWFGVELSFDNHKAFYVPEGFAHGFQTLVDNSEVFYQISSKYHPDSTKGIKWNDGSVNIKWPIKESIISDRDKSLPNLETAIKND